jgi:hypothetical protein
VKPVKFPKYNGLYDGKALSFSGFKIKISLFSIEAMKQFPTCISKPEKILSVPKNIMAIGAY